MLDFIMNITSLPEAIITHTTSFLPLKDSLKIRELNKASKQTAYLFLNKIEFTRPREGLSLSPITTLKNLFKNIISVKKVSFASPFLQKMVQETDILLEEKELTRNFESVNFRFIFSEEIRNLPLISSIFNQLLTDCHSMTLTSGSIRNQTQEQILFHEIALSQAKNIKSLNLDGIVINDRSLESLEKMKNLKHLVWELVRFEENVNRSSLTSPKAHNLFRYFKSLELFRSVIDPINFDGIKALAENKNLRILDIKIEKCTDSHLKYFYEEENGELHFPNLSTCRIQFDGYANFDDETIETLKEKRNDIQWIIHF